MARERIGQGPVVDSLLGANWPGSEKARYQMKLLSNVYHVLPKIKNNYY